MSLSLILTVLKAIPALKGWWDELTSAYVALKIGEMKKENRDAIKKAIEQRDQRFVEDILSPGNSGEASHLDGTELRAPPARRLSHPEQK